MLIALRLRDVRIRALDISVAADWQEEIGPGLCILLRRSNVISTKVIWVSLSMKQTSLYLGLRISCISMLYRVERLGSPPNASLSASVTTDASELQKRGYCIDFQMGLDDRRFEKCGEMVLKYYI